MLETGKTAAEQLKLESKFVTLADGLVVHYQEAGPADAPAVLLAHGFLGSLRDWRFVTGPLAALAQSEGFPLRTIAFDWVGFGRSSKPNTNYSLFYFADFLKHFADTLKLSDFDLMGHSMGGKHALAFKVLYPQYVRKLVLVDTDGFLNDPWWTRQTEKSWFKPLANLSTDALGKEGFLRLFFKNIFFDPKFYPSSAELTQAALELRDEDYRLVLRALNRDYLKLSLNLTGLRARLGEIKDPVQIFWGREDKILALKDGYQAMQELPNAKLTIFDQCGHLPQIEKAEEFNRRALKFLRQ